MAMAIKKGDKVTVHYTGKLADGTVFDSSRDRGQPLEFVLGEGNIIPGFEAAVEGHGQGDKVSARITPAEGYGDADEELIFTVPRARMPADIPLEPGTPLQLSTDMGQMDVMITEVGLKEVTLDANHPLAGKDLEFEIEILDAKPGKE